MYFIEFASLQPATMDKLLPDTDNCVLTATRTDRLGNWTLKMCGFLVYFEMSSSNMFLAPAYAMIEPIDDVLLLFAFNYSTKTKKFHYIVYTIAT